MTLVLCVKDRLFKRCQIPPTFKNPFKFSFCIDTPVIVCICVLLFRQSCYIIVDIDKRQRLYLLEVAA